MTDKELIEWLLRILGVLLGALGGLLGREVYSLRRRVHDLENWCTILSLNLSLVCKKIGIPYHGRESKR